MTAHLSRRSLLRAAPALAVPVTLLAPLPALAALRATPDPLPGLLVARKAAEDAWKAIPETMSGKSPAEKAAWDEYARLECLIETTVATSPEGVAAQLTYMKESYGSPLVEPDQEGEGLVYDVPVAFLDVILEGVRRIGQ